MNVNDKSMVGSEDVLKSYTQEKFYTQTPPTIDMAR